VGARTHCVKFAELEQFYSGGWDRFVIVCDLLPKVEYGGAVYSRQQAKPRHFETKQRAFAVPLYEIKPESEIVKCAKNEY
jgi:hypothetical protein